MTQEPGCSTSDLTFKKPFPSSNHKLLWKNWVDEKRFCVVSPSIIEELSIRCYGFQVITLKDIYIGSNLVARRDQTVCYLHPYEVLFLVTESSFISIIYDNPESILTPFEIATRLINFKTFSPDIYVRYRQVSISYTNNIKLKVISI